jgi:photosynthetic reaction center H subunit
MQTGAITGYIDVAQLTLYVFWGFFFSLVYYLRQEDKREGYPLVNEPPERLPSQGYPPVPRPKTFILPHGGTVTAPHFEPPQPVIKATPIGPWQGAPLQPDGDPMVDGVGPAAYAQRRDEPDLSADGKNRIVPLRVATDFHLDEEDPEPRGMQVVGLDGVVAGTVVDVWVDRSEMMLRYLEVDAGGRLVLLPVPLSKVNGRTNQVNVASVKAAHFALAPVLRNPDQVSLLEEDRTSAFFASGHLYATPERSEPII